MVDNRLCKSEHSTFFKFNFICIFMLFNVQCVMRESSLLVNKMKKDPKKDR